MAEKVVVIGAGPGGYVAAIRAAQLGAAVTVVEAENVGGTCLNWGCIPSKVMINSARMLDRFHQAKAFGIAVDGEIRPDMQSLMLRKNAVIHSQIKGILGLLKHHHIEYIQGKGYLKGPHLAGVATPAGMELEISWDKLILATGTRPLNVSAFPFDGRRILSSNHALSLQQVPSTVLIVGGGVVGCEFAFILASLGARVTLVEMMPRLLPLPGVDPDCAKILQREMKKKKITCLLGQKVDAVADQDGKLRVTLAPPAGEKAKPATVEADQILVCVGRRSNTDGIGLENIGLAPDAGGWITVNERMETAASDVYAVGDILGPDKIMLAHVATTEGRIAAENALGRRRRMNYDVVPSAIFTMPEVANVGLTESQAVKQDRKVRADSVLFRSLGKAHVIGEIAGQVKVISDAADGKILGIHIIGPHATELIAEAALAMRMGARVQDLAGTIHAHPTISEIMLEVSQKALGRAVHG